MAGINPVRYIRLLSEPRQHDNLHAGGNPQDRARYLFGMLMPGQGRYLARSPQVDRAGIHCIRFSTCRPPWIRGAYKPERPDGVHILFALDDQDGG